MTPTDEIGCKRIMLTDEWYPTLTKPNVELVTDRIAEVTPTGIRTEDGTERPADVLVLATGFKTHGFVAPMEIVGAGGRTLAEEWAEVPRAYLGMSVPGFPNMFLLYGPNTNGGTGSVIYTIEAGMSHVIAALGELARADARRIEVRRQAAEAFDRELRAALAANRLAHRLHELVRRRERQRPEPVAVAVEHLPPQDRADRAGRVRAERARARPRDRLARRGPARALGRPPARPPPPGGGGFPRGPFRRGKRVAGTGGGGDGVRLLPGGGDPPPRAGAAQGPRGGPPPRGSIAPARSHSCRRTGCR